MRLQRSLTRVWRVICAASVFLLLALPLARAVPPGTALAEPHPAQGFALVIGNVTYGDSPMLSACGPSAHAVAAALRRIGFRVTERDNATLGQMDGAIGDFATELMTATEAPAFVYICSYATALSGRTFFLPVSAALTRPTDVLTQGVLAAGLKRVLASRHEVASVLALDLVVRPDVSEPSSFGALGSAAVPEPLGLVVVRDTKPGSGPTVLARALVAGLAGPTVRTGPLVTEASRQLATARPTSIAVAVHAPATALYLAGAPPLPPPRAPTRKPAAGAPPVAAPPLAAPVVAAPPAPRAGPPPVMMPAEAGMTDDQRRQVQAVLSGVGYYDGSVDGVFGPETRAAIRRYQHEIHADMTGVLTAGQATILVNHDFR